MAKTCNLKGCNNPVFGGGYCSWHDQYRTDKKPKGITKKTSRVKPMSDKRKSDNDKYKEIKAQKKIDLIKGENYKCFFSGIYIGIDNEVEWHHLTGKEGSLLYEYDNIFPVIRKYHTQYHHHDIATLLKERWYTDFLERIMENKEDNDFIAEVFRIEERRIDKLGV